MQRQLTLAILGGFPAKKSKLCGKFKTLLSLFEQPNLANNSDIGSTMA